METLNETFEIITPCFCAGADPKTAELRAPSIRGELRWWFRVLGGTPEAEKALFGGVHNGTAASKIGIRVKNVNPLYGQPSELPQQNRDGYYLFHFARVSQRPQGSKEDGPRYQKEAWFKPGTTFDIEVFQKLDMTAAEEQGFKKAWKSSKLLGSLGLRQTRGLGAFKTTAPPAFNDFKTTMAELALRWWIIINNQDGRIKNTRYGFDSLVWLEAVLGWLRGNGFSAGRTGNNYTPLGTSNPRQASALRLRPLQLKEGLVSILFYTPQILSKFNQYDENELFRLLNGRPTIKTPYRQNPKPPDNREEISLRTF